MFQIVIPARYASTRLPGKPLLAIAGKPMLQWVYERARRSRAQNVVIATDDERISAAAHAFGAQVQMTSPAHQSGTDRIAEVARKAGWAEHDIIVNVQGDEPLMPPALIDQVALLLGAHPQAHIATLATPLLSAAQLSEPNVVKVVTDPRGRALYFSRAGIPHDRDHGGIARARRHLGIYAYRAGALQQLASLLPTPLEQLEKLEQLRALENGMEIRVADAHEVPGPDVNAPEDVARVEALLKQSAP